MRDAQKFAQFFHSMSAINRFSQFRLVNPESVLEHTGMVGITTMILCDMAQVPTRTAYLALRHALAHDVDEILTGDISMPTKYASKASEDALRDIARSNMAIICTEYELNIFNDWDSSNHASYHTIVKLADVLAVFYKAYQEIDMFNNRTMIDAIQQLLPAIMRRHAAFIEHFPDALSVTDLCEDVCESTRYLKGA